MDHYTIFQPGSPLIDMRDEYEELNLIPGIEKLDDRQIRFAWFYASPSSPYAKQKPKDRKKTAIVSAYRRDNKSESRRELETFNISELPDALQNVIQFFERNNINVRVRSKLMMEKTFQDIELMVHEFDATDKDSDSAGYMASIKNAMGLLPGIIQMVEGTGFGVKKARKATAMDENEPNIEDI